MIGLRCTPQPNPILQKTVYTTPAVRPDDTAWVRIIPTNIPLLYEDDYQVFQVLLSYVTEENAIHFSLRFAYCNPETVLVPFCDIVAWLMQRYTLSAVPMRYIETGDPSAKSRELTDADGVCSTLLPQMKQLWDRWQEGTGYRIAKMTPDEAWSLFDK